MKIEDIVFESSHGSDEFPLIVCRNDSGADEHLDKHFVYCHWHSDIEFVYVEQGKAIFQIDAEYCQIPEGQAAVINSGQLHSAHSVDNSRCILHAVVFNPSMLSLIREDNCQRQFIRPLINNEIRLPSLITGSTSGEREVLGDLIKLIEIYAQGSFGYEFKIKALLFSILSSIYSSRSYTEAPRDSLTFKQRKIDKLKKVLSYIEDNYSSKLSIPQLAELAGMSPDNFYKFFKGLTGKTPVEYINIFRITKAADLLQDSSISVLDAAMSSGFDNFSYFIRTFRKYKNITPGQFRRRMLRE